MYLSYLQSMIRKVKMEWQITTILISHSFQAFDSALWYSGVVLYVISKSEEHFNKEKMNWKYLSYTNQPCHT